MTKFACLLPCLVLFAGCIENGTTAPGPGDAHVAFDGAPASDAAGAAVPSGDAPSGAPGDSALADHDIADVGAAGDAEPLSACAPLQGSCADPTGGPQGSPMCFEARGYPTATIDGAKKNCKVWSDAACARAGAVLGCLAHGSAPEVCTLLWYYAPVARADAEASCARSNGVVVAP